MGDQPRSFFLPDPMALRKELATSPSLSLTAAIEEYCRSEVGVEEQACFHWYQEDTA